MKKIMKIFSLLVLLSSIGITYAMNTFSKLLEDVDFFEEEIDEE